MATIPPGKWNLVRNRDGLRFLSGEAHWCIVDLKRAFQGDGWKIYKHMILSAWIVGIVFAGCNAAFGKDLNEGVRSLGASSTAGFSWSEYDTLNNSDTYRNYDLSLEFGYFVFRNFETGTTLTLSYMDSSRKNVNTTTFSLSPYIAYHFPLSQKANLYTAVGAGYGRTSYSSTYLDKDHSNTTHLFAELGCEYFFSDHIAVALGLKKNQIYVDYSDDDWNFSSNQLTTQLKLRLYF